MDEKQPESGVTPETQETETSQTFAKEQVDQMMAQVRSDSLAELGRVRKSAEEAIKKATESANQRFKALLKQRDEEEIERVKDEPDKLTTIKLNQRLRDRELELEEARAQLNEVNTRLTETANERQEAQRTTVVQQVAAKHKVDSATLAKLAKHTTGTVEALEEIAQSLPQVSAPLKPDSNRSSGGGPKDKYQLMRDFSSGKINNVQYQEQMKELGLTP